MFAAVLAVAAVGGAIAPVGSLGAAQRGNWLPLRRLALDPDVDKLAFSRTGVFALRGVDFPSDLVVGRIGARGQLVHGVRVAITLGHHYPDAELCDESLAVNNSGDVFIAWAYDSNYQGPCTADHTGVALVRAGTSRPVIREIGPHQFLLLDTAINERGVGVALFDGARAVRMSRSGAVGVQHVEQSIDPSLDSIGPLAVDANGRFRFTAFRTRANATGAVVKTATADPAGRFGKPNIDLAINQPVDAGGGAAVAGNSRGDEVVAWPASSLTEPAPLWLALRRNGHWIQRRRLKPGSDSEIAAAVGSDGTAVVAFSRPVGHSDRDHLVAALAPARAGFGPLRPLGTAGTDEPAAIVQHDGSAIVAWEPHTAHFDTWAALAPAGHNFAAPVKLAPSPCIYPALALDGSGHPVATLNCTGSRALIGLTRLR